MCSKDCRGVRSHCGKHRFGVAPGGARALLLVLAVGLGLWWAPGAQAAVCQASGSIPLSPVPSTGLQVGDSIAIGVTITNTSSTTPLPGTAASAELRAFGTVRLRLACQDDNCLTPNPGVLTFVNCTGLAAGVDGCIPDPADPTNTVLIQIGSAGVALGAGAVDAPIATIHATVAATADACAGDASFQFTQGFTGGIRPDCGTTPGCSGTFTQTVRTTDANCTPQASGSATGSTSYQVPLVCEGTFCDPQVCDTDDQSATFGQCIADTPPTCASTGTCNAGFCNPATDACDVQPANPGTECRPSADGGVCDPPELCTGTSTDCPPNVFRPSSVECRASADGGVCDPPEFCTGTSAGCPADVFRPSSTQCRASADGGVCDPPEFCTGTSGGCPADVFRPSSVVCRPSSDGGICDPPENCTGTSAGCPPDVFRPDNTACTDDGNECTNDICVGGVCTHPATGESTTCINPSFGVSSGTCAVIETDAHKVDITGPFGAGVGVLGDVCIGAGGRFSISGSQRVTGDLRFEGTKNCGGCNGHVTGSISENDATVTAAINSCLTRAENLGSLGCDQTFGDLKGSATVLAGKDGQNVICATNLKASGDKDVIFDANGHANVTFVVNVTGGFTTNGKILVNPPLGTDDLVVNVLGTGGQVAFTGGGGGLNCCKAVLQGSLLAVDRKVALSPGLVLGLLCSGLDISIVSGASVQCQNACIPDGE